MLHLQCYLKIKIFEMEDQNVAFRLKGFIDSQGITNSQFADLCGIPRPSLSQLLSGRNKKISDVLVAQIHKAFPKLSVLWLLFDEGPMLVADSDTSNKEDASLTDDKNLEQGNLFSSENSVNASNSSNKNLFSNVSALTDGGYASQLIEKECDELKLQIAGLQSEIAKFKKNPRRVSQITVYYDDSTFETFFPISKKS